MSLHPGKAALAVAIVKVGKGKPLLSNGTLTAAMDYIHELEAKVAKLEQELEEALLDRGLMGDT